MTQTTVTPIPACHCAIRVRSPTVCNTAATQSRAFYLAERYTFVSIIRSFIHTSPMLAITSRQGADRANACLTVLPPLYQFSACFTSPVQRRSRTTTCTHVVATLSDFESLLLHMATGFMPTLVFAFPINRATHDEHLYQPWLSAERAPCITHCRLMPAPGH